MKLIALRDDNTAVYYGRVVPLNKVLASNVRVIRHDPGYTEIEYDDGRPNKTLDGAEADKYVSQLLIAVKETIAEEDAAIKAQQEAWRNSWDRIRADRESELRRVRWMIERHRDQVDMGAPTSLSDNQYRELLRYVQELRDLPQELANAQPRGIVLPKPPEFTL